jgi:hypothetical protein
LSVLYDIHQSLPGDSRKQTDPADFLALAVTVGTEETRRLAEQLLASDVSPNIKTRSPALAPYFPDSYLHVAVRNRDKAMITMLLKHGAHVHNDNWTERIIWGFYSHRPAKGSPLSQCLGPLLAAGCPVDIPLLPGQIPSTLSVYPNACGPVYMLDAFGTSSADDHREVFNMCKSHSQHLKDYVTVPGILQQVSAAHFGQDVFFALLDIYFEGRCSSQWYIPTESDQIEVAMLHYDFLSLFFSNRKREMMDEHRKRVLLEMALSQAAGLGCHQEVVNLVRFGVNPRVPYLDAWLVTTQNIFYRESGSPWFPVVRAMVVQDLATLEFLNDRGVEFNHPGLLEAAFNSLAGAPNAWREKLLNFLVRLNERALSKFGSALVCALQSGLHDQDDDLCFWFVDKLVREGYNLDKSSKIEGMSLTQYAIHAGCSLQTIRLFSQDDEDYHSIPCERTGRTMLNDALRSPSKERGKIFDFLLRQGCLCTIDSTNHGPTMLECALDKTRPQESLQLFNRLKSLGASLVQPRCELRSYAQRAQPLLSLLIDTCPENDAAILGAVDGGISLDCQESFGLKEAWVIPPLAMAAGHGQVNLVNEHA